MDHKLEKILGNVVYTSQMAFPASDCRVVYGDSRYGNSAGSLGQITLDSDNVYS